MKNDPMLAQFGALWTEKKKKVRCNDISNTLRHRVKVIMELKSVAGKDVCGDLIELKELES